MLKSKLIAATAILGLAALSLAAVIDGYSFKRTPKEGETHKYKQTGKFEAGGMEIEYEAKSTQKVTKVEADGSYAEESTTSDVKMNGQEPPEGAAGGGQKTTTKFSAKGEVVEIKNEQVSAEAYRFANLAIFISPETDIKVGDSWSYEVKEDKKTGAAAAKATYTLTGEDKVGTVDALKLKFVIKETAADGASSEGTIWVSKADYTLLKTVAKWTNAPIPGAPVTINGEMTVTLID